MFVLLCLWVVVLFDPQWLVAAYGPNAVLRLPTALFGALALSLALGLPINTEWRRRWQWYPPMLCSLAAGSLALSYALNIGFVRDSLQVLLLQWSLIVGAVAFIGSPRRAERLLLLFCLSFVWWGLWGARRGLVPWHPLLSNFDGYGAYMVIGIGLCSFVLVATTDRTIRYLMMASVAMGAVGVVASFARGAFLAGLAVFLAVLLRSPRKGATLGAGLAAGIIVFAAASLIHPGQFWAEIQSAFQEGTSEGTGEDRWILWTAASRVFLDHPILGVGYRNFGVYAAQFFEVGDLGGMYELNPARLYGRSLHSVYFTILSEQGLVGCALFAWVIVDFWRRNRALQSIEADHRWIALGGTIRLSLAARGLEAAMVGFLTVAAVYSVAGFQCYYALLALNLLLHSIVFGKQGAPRRTSRSRAPLPAEVVVGAQHRAAGSWGPPSGRN